MEEIKILTVFQVITLHTKSLKKYGGETGVLKKNYIESSLDISYMEAYPIPWIAGKLFYRFSTSHIFIDGNKRVSFLVAKAFLDINNYKYTGKIKDVKELAMKVAKSEATDKDCMAHFFS